MIKVMVERVSMTAEGRIKLDEELNSLLKERPILINSISTARDQGDLSENAEYHAARERQSFVEGRIQELESLKSRSEVIDVSKLSGDTVMFGATVKLRVIDDEVKGDQAGADHVLSYKIVSEYEADVSKKLLSVNSPLASALIRDAKREGEYVEVKTPGGEKLYQIMSISFE